ncbi:MAG TPA: HEAT repeat domain-containing protein, partial [Candidatus Ozemobacteraceae bacterium]|nr:HEAT repeat domain-containing protein [Candidatus Ozemobacteraceae bacterium]
LLAAAEAVLDPEQALFDYAQFPANQLDRLWLFGFDDDRDDPVLEALFVAFDAISRFKKNLESQPQLAQARARLSIGLALGPVTRFIRGPLGHTTLAGKTVYLAETLAEAAGDFQIYIDQEIHHLSQPLFDFREWKPMKLRPILPQLSFFEVVGLNKREEIFAFASHKEAVFRQAVAISYRYLEMSDVTPLLSLVADSDERVALEALKTVSFLGDQRAQGILKKYLSETKNAGLRAAVIEALSATGKEDIVPLLLAASKDVHWQVRFKAAQGLYTILRQDSIKHLAPLRQDDDGAVRSAIHEIYFKETGERSEVQALGNLLTDLSVRARKAAMEALARIGNDDAMQLLAQSFRQQDHDLRKAMVRVVAGSRSPQSHACLLKMFANCD